ncbi:putative ATP-dependent RNA helicase TDRD12 [Pempheris klunzingeri]|uniref:putative ATP-dependent RNA helicase TDRD12 n=1 Tax=Pempheris klunzingeri TaxID=3127111 RepID=UPI0039804C7B
MLKISILKVENPSCLWGRVVGGLCGDSETAEQYDSLQTQMNLFYHSVAQDLRRLKPTALEKGQVCVVYWSALKLWCRAVVESIIMDSVSCQVRCLLVDHGERLVAPSDQIRVAVQDFLQLPFWVRRFHLAGIRPTRLRVPVCEEKAELIGSTQWDSSATLYLHNLLQASTWTEGVLLQSESGSTSVELYLTIENIKICVNDDLVVKKFAYYIRESADGGGPGEVDQFPVMLSSNILTMHSAARTVRSPQFEPKSSEEGSGSKVTREQPSPDGRSKSGSDAAAAESDSSEDTDSSLAAALTKSLSLFRFLKFLNQAAASVSPRAAQEAFQHVKSEHTQEDQEKVSEQEKPKDCGPAETPAETPAASRSCTGQEVYAAAHLHWFMELKELKVLLRAGGLKTWGMSGGGTVLGAFITVTHQLDQGQTHLTAGGKSAEKPRRTEEDWACSRLLEWLNPEPVSPGPADVVVPSDPGRRGVLVHAAAPVEPCSSLEDAPITESLRRVLWRKQYVGLSPADRYSWPAVARGGNTVIVSHDADRPLSYLAPLLTHILLNSIFTSLTSSAGPVAVLLCPGWEKVQATLDLLEEFKVGPTLHPVSVLLGVGKDEAKAVRIPKNCLLLVTTPFSLVRMLSCHCFLFLRLYHLVLDEADQLFAHAPDQMATILQHFQKVTSSEEKVSCPRQLVVVAKRWSSHMEGLLATHMPYPCVVMTVPEEAALYGDVRQTILMTLENSKVSALLAALDFNPDVAQKTLIVASSAQEVQDIFKAVSNKSVFCLMTHEGLSHQFDLVVRQWRKDIGPGTHVILVSTSDCLSCLGIRDATCVVHYAFPTSPKVFGSRLFCMADNFRNLSERVSSQDQTESCRPPSRSVLLISERNARHVVGVLRYLVRTNAPLPPELLSFAQGVHVAREDQKTHRPLCSYLKSFGVCRDRSVCPGRHTLCSQLDRSVLPASGVVEVVPLYIKTASVFYGRIVSKDDGGFQSMVSEMTSFYADKKPGAQEVLEGGLYAVQEDEVFHRVKVLSVPERGGRLFFTVLAQFLDVGKEEVVKSHQLLKLPEQFHSVPGQAVEIVVCRVKPVDAETDWHPKVTRAIGQRIRGLQHRARAVCSLGRTLFVDPMVRVTQVAGMKTVINEYSVQTEILNTGMGARNPDHLNLLRALCQEAGPLSGQSEAALFVCRSGDGPLALEVRIKTQEDVLAEAFRAAGVGAPADLPHLESSEPPSLMSSASPGLEADPRLAVDQLDDQRTRQRADLRPAEQTISRVLNVSAGHSVAVSGLNRSFVVLFHRNEDKGEICSPTGRAAHLHPAENGGDQSSSQQVINSNETHCSEPKSFHPQVLWHQTSGSVVVTVKLMNPESQRCDFYPDRVVYSGRANGRTYRADLELHANIAADCCCWEMKSNEPVLKLVKQQQGRWDRLLRNKNIFVSYDTEHLEEDEDRTPNGVWFVENTGEDNCYVLSESGSESD